jgi:hypothetical protein
VPIFLIVVTEQNTLSSVFSTVILLLLFIYLFIYLFILTANGFLPDGSGTTIRYTTHHTQNTAHKTTQTIKDTLHTMDTMQIQLYKLILITNKHTVH